MKFKTLTPENFINPSMLPSKNTVILGVTNDNIEHYLYLCTCGHEWLDAQTNKITNVSVAKWIYVDNTLNF